MGQGMIINQAIMRHVDHEALTTQGNVRRFLERAKNDGYGTFTISGHELVEGDYMDGWAIRIYGEAIPLQVHYALIGQGKEVLNPLNGVDGMPALSLSGRWLEEAGLHYKRSCTIEYHRSYLLLRTKRSRRKYVSLEPDEVPNIYLEGEWLYNAGFYVGSVAKVAVHESYLLITPIRNFARDPDSFINWQRKHGKKGISHFREYYESLNNEQRKHLSQ
jgi:hypothetical protein